MIEKSQTRRRVLRQRNVLPVAANVIGDGAANLQRMFLSVCTKIAPSTVSNDLHLSLPGIALSPDARVLGGMPEKQCEMNIIRRQFKTAGAPIPSL